MVKSSSNQPNKDNHFLGKDTKHLIVTNDDKDTREWLADSEVCPLLSHHHIAHLGVMWGEYPLTVSRSNQEGSYFMACASGVGEVLIDGVWKKLRAGDACLLPPLSINAFRCIEGESWEFCWVRYAELPHRLPISSFLTPVRASFDQAPLAHAIRGLHLECKGLNQPAALNLWTELIHQYVIRFTKEGSVDERLWKLWKTVELKLGHSWTLQELAKIACVSEEHLRRLCNKHLGRSPMQQLTYLRMQKARILLGTTDDKIEVISHQLGYENPFTFSNTFKKWVGWRPSEVR